MEGGGGPGLVQSLLLAAGVHGAATEAADLVVLDAALREGAAVYFRAQTGLPAVHAALDALTREMPKLDIALIGSLPHFADYALPAADGIATDAASLTRRLFGWEGLGCVYVLDASFVESGEGFLRLGLSSSEGEGGADSLIVIPYVALAQLGTSIANGDVVVSFDMALQEAIHAEPFLASQRLRALRALLQGPSGAAPTARSGRFPRQVRVLHFTECLQAHGILPKDELAGLGLDPSDSDNDHLILVLAMLGALAPPNVRVVLCTDDRAMVETLQRVSARLFARKVEVLSTEVPKTVVDPNQGIVNDTPSFNFDLEDFIPKWGPTTVRDAAQSPARSPPDDSVSLPNEGLEGVRSYKGNPSPAQSGRAEELSDLHLWDSPWLSMLHEPSEDPIKLSSPTTAPDDQTKEGSSAPAKAASPTNESPISLDETKGEGVEHPHNALMDLYESPNDVIPIGVKIQEADALGNIFEQFDVMEPDARVLMEEEIKARKSRLTATGGGANSNGKPRRRRSTLQKEALSCRGASNKERYHLARQLSNQSGGRVPFNFRYQIFEANILDPRNAPLRKSYEEAIQKKREAFKRNRL
ncbi:unnamed protein product, partial [Phytomonas sp. Hart1]